jgi:Ca2+-binding RTX toxin-like protein
LRSDRNYFYALPDNFDNLDIYNKNVTVNGRENRLGQFQPNFVYGNALPNYIRILDEVTGINGFNNHIDGQGGADTMAGGLGNDTYVVDDSGDYAFELSSQGTDWIFASDAHTLQDNIENLQLLEFIETIDDGQPDTRAVVNLRFNGTGNSLNNSIEGNSGNNFLSGEGGADTIRAGGGDDTLLGGDGNDSLVGGDGTDSMVGGAGNDVYSVENESDVIVESLNGGFDIVFSLQNYGLSTGLEVLNLQGNGNIAGYGNDENNSLVGNNANNILLGYAGDDTLDGGGDIANVLNPGGGFDTLAGGAGNDYYFLRNVEDVITENSGQGTDTIFSLINHTLPGNFENLILGGGLNGAATGQGNAADNSLTANTARNSVLQGLGGNDTLVGGGLNDNLDGGTGNDSMSGGAGNDTYIVDSTLDIVFENSSSGTDQISSSVNFTLSSNVENLVLTLATNLNGTGNGLSNNITGNAGNNSLFGLGGRDNLTGAAGNDTLDGGDLEDSLVGGSGSDSLSGGDESDILNGSSAAVANEIDTLTGGTRGDLFVLGGSVANFYGIGASNNYAYITDFSVAEGDQLLLRAGLTYQIHNTPQAGGLSVGSSNSYIYLDVGVIGAVGAGDNLIAAIVATGGALQTSDLNTIGIFV